MPRGSSGLAVSREARQAEEFWKSDGFLSAIILDINLQICFHKLMIAAELKNSPTYAARHAPFYNHDSVAQDANTKQP